jgi:broad specificity phosphatase PhoE
LRDAAHPVERRLYLVRHAEAPNITADGRLVSTGHSPLSERGRRQAAALGERFAHVRTAAVHASDMPRAAETAGYVAGDRPVRLYEALREISLGDLDGALAEEVFSTTPGFLSDPAARLPGGETPLEVAERAGSALERILADDPERDVIVVAHGGVNRTLLGRLLDLPLEQALRIRQDWASVDVLDRAAGRWWARCFNWTPWGLNEFAQTRRVAMLDQEQWVRMGR